MEHAQHAQGGRRDHRHMPPGRGRDLRAGDRAARARFVDRSGGAGQDPREHVSQREHRPRERNGDRVRQARRECVGGDRRRGHEAVRIHEVHPWPRRRRALHPARPALPRLEDAHPELPHALHRAGGGDQRGDARVLGGPRGRPPQRAEQGGARQSHARAARGLQDAYRRHPREPRAGRDPPAAPARRARRVPRSPCAQAQGRRSGVEVGAAHPRGAQRRGLRAHRDRSLRRGLRPRGASRPARGGHAKRARRRAGEARMNVAVIGTGYVGLVVGACLAETGNDVICADVDERKIGQLRQNRLPIYEPGLEPLVTRNQRGGRLQCTTDVPGAIERSDIVFIAVGTPPDEDGSADLQHVLTVARTIGQHMNGPKIVITKSTVPVGTAELVRAEIAKHTTVSFRVCSNPEFLKEGAAVEDFMKPDRVVVGVDSPEAAQVLGELYAPFVRTGNPIMFMDIPSAEITKYAANAMLATRISFMNQVARLCEAVGADVTHVRKGIGTDRRIGSAFLFPGPGYGGSCFPKDVKALLRTAATKACARAVLAAAELANDRQKRVLFEKLQRHFDGDLEGETFAIWGLAFKAETDDVRESPALVLVEELLCAGAKVRVHDPAALDTARRYLGDRVTYAAQAYDALQGAAALAIVTEWLEYRNPDFARIRQLLSRRLIVDGRNLYDPSRLARLGLTYDSIGRRLACASS